MAARAYRLKTGESAGEGLRRAAEGRAERALERLDGAAGKELAAAVHGARKDLKKLRALLRLLRPRLGEELFAAESHRYRNAGRLLAGSRDAQVKLETLVALRSGAATPLPAAEVALWESELEAERDAAAAALQGDAEALAAQASEALVAGRDQIAEWPLGAEGWGMVGPGLRRTYRDGRQAQAAVEGGGGAGTIHAWRKRVKDLWYQLLLLQEAWPGPLRASAAEAHALAEALGDHHDLAVLAEDLGGRWGVSRREPLTAAIEARQQALLEEALALGARLYAEKPKAFSRRLRAYWRAWRRR